MIKYIVVLTLITHVLLKPLEFDLILHSVHPPHTMWRHLLEQDMMLLSHTDDLLTFQLCAGTPPQCFQTVYDTTASHLFLQQGHHHLNKTSKHFFQSTLSSSFNSTNQRISAPLARGTVTGDIVNDVIHFNKQTLLFDWVLSHNELNGEGYIGFSREYKGNKTIIIEGLMMEIDLSPKFSFMNLLYENKIISKRIFSHTFISPERGKLYLGDVADVADFRSTQSCTCGSKETGFTNENVNDKWNCRLAGIYLQAAGEEIKIITNEYAVLDTGTSFIYAPMQTGMEILDNFKKYVHKGIECDVIKKFNSSMLYCGQDPRLYHLPDLIFEFNSTKISITPQDLIKPLNVSELSEGYSFGIVVTSQVDYFVLGLSILKKYHVIFNQDENTVTFSRNVEAVSNTKLWIAIFIIVISFTAIVIFLCYRQKTKKSLMKSEENSSNNDGILSNFHFYTN